MAVQATRRGAGVPATEAGDRAPPGVRKDFFRSVLNYRKTGGPEYLEAVCKHHPHVAKAALSEVSGVGGGFTVPVGYSADLLTAVAERSIIRPRARVVPMTTRTVKVPRPKTTGSGAAGTSPFFGGLTFTWGQGADNATLAQNEPSFALLTLTAWDLIGQLVASNDFATDLGDAGEAALLALFAEAAAWAEDYAFFNGTGAGQPLGILKTPAALDVTRAGAGHIAQADLAKMARSLIPGGWAGAVFCCSPTAVEDVIKTTAFIPNQNYSGFEGDNAGWLLTRPLYITEKLPALGTRGDLVFFDASAYVIGDRQDTEIDVSTHALFRSYQTVFKVWRRVDGRPSFDSTVTLADGTTTAGCVVVLS